MQVNTLRATSGGPTWQAGRQMKKGDGREVNKCREVKDMSVVVVVFLLTTCGLSSHESQTYCPHMPKGHMFLQFSYKFVSYDPFIIFKVLILQFLDLIICPRIDF